MGHENTKNIKTDVGLLVAAIEREVGANSSYILIDFPDHSNVGDSLIWLGELIALRSVFRKNPLYTCSIYNFNYSHLKKLINRTTVIFLHGGGNLGDIWPEHQRFREMIIGLFPENCIVQLPQTVHFSSLEAVERARSVFDAHPNFSLMVRDRRSQEFALQALGCRAHLLPDSAFAIGVLPRPAPSKAVQYLLRTDVESGGAVSSMESVQSVDWIGAENRDFPWATGKKIWINAMIRGHLSHESKKFYLYKSQAESRLRRGMGLLGQGERVVTDRLHAHILCLLMGIPHVVIDNNYGKISGYIESFTCKYSKFSVASNLKEAISILGDFY